MIKQQLEKDLKKAVKDLGYKTTDIVCDISQNPSFGDYTSNIALQLSKLNSENSKQTTLEIANKIQQKFGKKDYLDKIEIASPGFINFFIKPKFLIKELKEILKEKENFGKNNFGKGKKIQVEFISANPTGPLTLANGRGGSLGDTLANVLKWNGYKVDKEYYVNDTGNQVRVLGESVLAAAGKMESKENHYQGEYIKDLAEKFKDDIANLASQGVALQGWEEKALEFGQKLADYLLEKEIKPAVKKMGIEFDEYYSERRLHDQGLIKKTADLLEERGLAYEKDGALWFKSAQFGDEKDRVLITSKQIRGSEEPTYLMPDIAHHLEIFKRGYEKRINILGADHHSYVVRLKLSVEAIVKQNWMDFILIQMVKLIKDGKEYRMSKRAGTYVTLDELVEAVGKDAARFFFLMYDPHSQINFDLDLAKEKSQKNPVYYVQYAHARMSNILAKAVLSEEAPSFAIESLIHPTELALIKLLISFPGLIEEISRTYQVHKLVFYATKLADSFHKFYENCRVINAESKELKQARLSLVQASKIVLKNTLDIMEVEAPERM